MAVVFLKIKKDSINLVCSLWLFHKSFHESLHLGQWNQCRFSTLKSQTLHYLFWFLVCLFRGLNSGAKNVEDSNWSWHRLHGCTGIQAPWECSSARAKSSTAEPTRLNPKAWHSQSIRAGCKMIAALPFKALQRQWGMGKTMVPKQYLRQG